MPIHGAYGPILVTLSVLVAILASYTALDLAGRVTAAHGRVRLAWLGGGSLAMGVGIWSMHFIGMLAFRLPVPMSYDVPLWLLSAVVAVVASAFALSVVGRDAVGTGSLLVAALLMGAAIAGMHYIGMAAMRIPGRIEYDSALVALSVAIAIAAAFAALWLACRLRKKETRRGRWLRAGSAVVMGLAIAGMHYTGMAAARFTSAEGAMRIRGDDLLATDGLAVSVVIGTVIILAVALLGAMIDRRLRVRATEVEAVRRSEARFRSLALATSQIVWTTAPSGEFETEQRAWSDFTGQSFQVAKGQGWLDAVHPEDRARTAHAWSAALQEQALFEVEYRLRRRDGEYRYMWVRAVPVLAADGSILEWVGVHSDISERKRDEQALLAAESHYRRLVETSPDGIFVLDAEGRFTEVNEAAVDILGLQGRTADCLGRHFSEFVVPEDLPKKEAAQRAKLSGETRVTDTELRVRTPSGDERLVHMRSTVIEEAGRVVGTHGIIRDITEERAREQTMRLLTTALDSFKEGVSLTTARDEVLYANAALTRILGMEPEAAQELDVPILLPDDAAREQYREIRHALATEGRWSGRVWRRRLSDGQVIPLDMIAGAVETPDGERNLFFVVHEATEEIERESRIRRVERLASVGTLIGGVAHELNNPLHAIRSFAELMLLDERGPEDQESLAMMKREAARAAKIVSDLRLIARDTQTEKSQRAAVNLNDVIDHVRKLRQYSLDTGNVEVREDLAQDLPPVLANRGELEQVVLNLVINAEQAMEGQAGERRLVLRTRQTRRGIALHVVDSGPGIPGELLDRIFDPFFTTKPPGEGTGLGLSLVHGIIAEHGGEIHVESESGKGTAFRIDLPPASAAEKTTPPERVVEAPARSLRILVVDDEDAVRRVSVRFLERIGHHVDAAAEGREALRLLEGTNYDVIISDLKMPGLSGEELFARLQDQGRGIEHRVIFMTGDAASTQAARALSNMNAPVLIKPVRLEDLACAVESMARERESAQQ